MEAVRVLIVEDNSVAEERRRSLREAGMKVSVACTLQAARWFYEEYSGQWDMITFDWGMPQKAGDPPMENTASLIRRVADDRRHHRCHALLIAASGEQEGRKQQMEAGCDIAISSAEQYVENILGYCSQIDHYRFRRTKMMQDELRGLSHSPVYI